MARFLEMGFRRSGRSVYVPACGACRECVSIRVPVERFRPTRDQRRAWRKNPDVTLQIVRPRYTEEKRALYERFLRARYPDHDPVSQLGYEQFLVDNLGHTWEFQYRIGERLVGVGVVDLVRGAASSVYFYFDPEESRRSLGTYTALREIEYCRETGREHLYLGFRVKGCRAMEYKSSFRPHELLSPSKGWVPEEEF